jgi:predicted RNase H-like nuclease (RuvC/YqgF family)
MATGKTPAHKRISRAENSAAEWKMKAIERREIAEALRAQLETASAKSEALEKSMEHCTSLEKQVKELTAKLEHANQTITALQADMNEFKKKAYR